MTKLLAAVALLILAGCGTSGTEQGVAAIQPRDGRSGLSLTGTVQGRQVAISAGAPHLQVGDCDIPSGRDDDVCFFTQDIDGSLVGLIFENPAVLQPGTSVPVEAVECGRDCDEVAGVAVVDFQRGGGEQRVRAAGGRVTVDVAEPFNRYAGEVRLELPGGNLSGSFDVVPRPE